MAVRPFNEFEVQRAAILKTWRAAIRLKHSLQADAEIAAKLPLIEERINDALLNGVAVELDAAQAFGENL